MTSQKPPGWQIWLKKVLQRIHLKNPPYPLVIPRAQHNLSRQQISSSALNVLYRLKRSSFCAYLVGGGVRDLLLGLRPKDFDVATDARPEQIARAFRNSRIIGRRFRLVHVFYDDEIIEVSTFRGGALEPEEGMTQEKLEKPDAFEDGGDGEQSPKIEKIKKSAGNEKSDQARNANNTYGTLEEDAWRRDFTVNALYYNIDDFSIVDYVGGLQDLKLQQLRMIGDPKQRYTEDPVRMLRAIRLASKLKFSIEPNTEYWLIRLKSLLREVAPSRLFDEVIKLLFQGFALRAYRLLQQYDYFPLLLPGLAGLLSQANKNPLGQFIENTLSTTDERVEQEQSLNPGFLLAALLWPVLQQRLQEHTLVAPNKPLFVQLQQTMEEVLAEQNAVMAIPARFTILIRHVWLLQFYLEQRRQRRILSILQQRYFRAGLDLLLLRARSGEPLKEVATWWRQLFQASTEQRRSIVEQFFAERKK